MTIETPQRVPSLHTRTRNGVCRSHRKPVEPGGGGGGLPPIDGDGDSWRWEPEPDPEDDNSDEQEYAESFLVLDIVCGLFCLLLVVVTIIRIFWLP